MAHIPKELMPEHKKRLARLAKAKTPKERRKILLEGQTALDKFRRKK